MNKFHFYLKSYIIVLAILAYDKLIYLGGYTISENQS